MKNVVYYHGNCQDGLMAAAVFANHFEEQNAAGGDEASLFVPCFYGKTVPVLMDCAGANVYIVDFAFPLEEMQQIATLAAGVIWLDHHATQKPTYEALKDDHRFRIYFDMNRCGCSLAWDHLHRGEERPPLIIFAEAHDLWKLDAVPYAREVNAWLRTQESTLPCYQQLLRWDDDAVVKAGIKQLGVTILATQRAMYQDICDRGHWCFMEDYPEQIPCAETTIGTSEVGEMLYNLYPNAPFSVVYHRQDEITWKYSLRSHKECGEDVSLLAENFGGGGHKNAAGFLFRVPPVLTKRLKP